MFEEAVSLNRAYRIQLRGPLDGGLSGAAVRLVNFWHGSQQRFGVLKLTSPSKAKQELDGELAARSSWLKPYLPDHSEALGELSDGRVAVLSSLARDRIENCQTLHACLRDSFSYAVKHALHAAAFGYRQEAVRVWKTATVHPIRDDFRAALEVGLRADWITEWRAQGLPGPEYTSIVFEDLNERWPNPVAYAIHDSLWPDAAECSTVVPRIVSHGDLNPNNVLCPTVNRAIGQGLVQKVPQPREFAKHLSLIDVPYCRVLPFPYDLAFLTSWLSRVLLPPFDSHARRAIGLNSFRSICEEIQTDTTPLRVPDEGARLISCHSEIWFHIKLAQPRMAEDTRSAYLACLSAAALWQAAKSATASRSTAVATLALGALALKTLLGGKVEHLPQPDFQLRMSDKPIVEHWTAAAATLGGLFESLRGRRQILLVLGSLWGRELRLPQADQLLRVRDKLPSEQSAIFESAPEGSTATALSTLGRLPLAAVVDLSVLGHPRKAIESGLSRQSILRPVYPGDSEPDWRNADNLYYFHLRGSFENTATLAFTPPERSRNRRQLRGAIARFRATRPSDLIVLYVGLSDEELPELHDYIQDIWSESLRSLFLESPASGLAHYCSEWGIQVVHGAITDFVTAARDLPQAEVLRDSPVLRGRVLRVADMQIDEDGQLTSAAGAVLEVPLSDEDSTAINRAGKILYESVRQSLKELTREPREFFIGHRITLAEVHHEVAIERERFHTYLDDVLANLDTKHPHIFVLNTRPGAGASTALRWLAYQLAFKHDVPTLILTTGNSAAFESLERLYRCVGRSFAVIADPRDVSSDELAALYTRCSPPRYPAVFLTSVRVTTPTAAKNVLPLELSGQESIDLIGRIGRYCPNVDIGALRMSRTRSLFLLTLEAFGGTSVKLHRFVADLLREATDPARFLIATVALFSRYTHRVCQVEFLQIVSGETADAIEQHLEPFDQLLILREENDWVVRHDQLSKCILQFYLTGAFDEQDYRHSLSELACRVIDRLSQNHAGWELAAEYVWALLNPQLEASRETAAESRFINGNDGIPYDTMRERVFTSANKAFPDHVNIVSHYGKFLAEQQQKWPDAERYLMHAYDLEPENEAVLHMLGKRYMDEVKSLLASSPAQRDDVRRSRISDLSTAAHRWFDGARALNRGSEYSYTTAIQLDIMLIRDEFKRLGATTPEQKTAALVERNVASTLAHAEAIVGEGLRYIEPREVNRRLFTLFRDQLHELRGDLNTAIDCFQKHVRLGSGPHLATARVQLARFLVQRAEQRWSSGNRGKAIKDFAESEHQLFEVLQDPVEKFKNVKLWFDSARHLAHWRRADFLDKLLQLHQQNPEELDAVFLLACLYFAEAVQSGSPESWRRYQGFQRKSEARSSNLGVRRYIREWLVGVDTSDGSEYRVYPGHLFDIPQARMDSKDIGAFVDNRIKLSGTIARVESSTVGFITIPPMGFQLFFQPRVKGHEFYKSDERRTRVTCMVAFTYEKPLAFDVERLT